MGGGGMQAEMTVAPTPGTGRGRRGRAAAHRAVEVVAVFTTAIGTPLDSRNVTKAFQSLLERVGLPRMRFHDLRHSAATLMLAEGVPPRVIMETLGHSNIGMTMNLYAHVVPSLQRDAADRMDEVLRLGA